MVAFEKVWSPTIKDDISALKAWNHWDKGIKPQLADSEKFRCSENCNFKIIAANVFTKLKDQKVSPYFKSASKDQQHDPKCDRIVGQIAKRQYDNGEISSTYGRKQNTVKLGFDFATGLQPTQISVNSIPTLPEPSELKNRKFNSNGNNAAKPNYNRPAQIKSIERLVSYFQDWRAGDKSLKLLDKNNNQISFDDLFIDLGDNKALSVDQSLIYFGNAYVKRFKENEDIYYLSFTGEHKLTSGLFSKISFKINTKNVSNGFKKMLVNKADIFESNNSNHEAYFEAFVYGKLSESEEKTAKVTGEKFKTIQLSLENSKQNNLQRNFVIY